MILLFLLPHALADDGLDAHGFHAAGAQLDVRSPLEASRVVAEGAGAAGVMGVVEYASAPLKQYTVWPDGTVEATPILDNVVTFDVVAGWRPISRLRLDAELPLFLASTGEQGPNGFLVGDARIAAMVTIVAPKPTGTVRFGLGVRPHLDVPTGSAGAWLGQPGVAGGGALVGGLDVGKLALTLNLGLQLNPAVTLENLDNADQFQVGGALGWAFSEQLALTAETRLGVGLAESVVAGTSSPSEVLFSGRYLHRSGGHALLGASVGFGDGVGTAAWRVFVGAGFGARGKEKPAANP